MLGNRLSTKALAVILVSVFTITGFSINGDYKSAATFTQVPLSKSLHSPTNLISVPLESRSTIWSDPRIGQLHLTNIINHAPGFTVFENLYWRNWTWYIVTDAPQLIPELNYIATRGYGLVPESAPPGEPIYLKALRLQPVLAGVPDNEQIGESTSIEEATEMFADAQVIDGCTFVTGDDHFIGHYYHYIGEIFLGAWRMWSNMAWRAGTLTPEWNRISFLRQWHEIDSPKPGDLAYTWEDPAGANKFLMKTLFPNTEIDTKKQWEQRAQSNQIYRFARGVLADRIAGHSGPSNADKCIGDVLRVPVNSDYLTILRDRILNNYQGSVNLQRPERLRVAYLSRQDTARRLKQETHLKLIEDLRELEGEGLIEFKVIHFTSDVSFKDQVATMVNVDILIGVHGNGLTHVLWMTPGERKAVFELQPEGCNINDYPPLATANGVQHYLVHGDKMCTPLNCHARGCTSSLPELSTVNRHDIQINSKLIVDKIRQILEKPLW